MNLALVHDWLNQVGGAEDVLEVLNQQYPTAPIYTSIYWRDHLPAHYRQWQIRTTWLDRMPGIYQRHQFYLPFYPMAFEQTKMDRCDTILSNKSGFCIGIRKPPGSRHVCYCLTPTRYVWDLDNYLAQEKFPPILTGILRPWSRAMQQWERRAAQQVDTFIAISKAVQQRIQQHYQRDSQIIYPPVDLERFRIDSRGDEYFLIVSRLIPYKRIDLAVEACSQLGIPLVVAGRGRDRERLEGIASPSVKFLGYVPPEELPALMAGCRAFLFPGLEDFGITPIQAMAAGKPVIAYAGGGALDYVIPNKTGQLFPEQTVNSLVSVLKEFRANDYSPAIIQAFAQQFDRQCFVEKIQAVLAA